jgi:hypothetical protein
VDSESDEELDEEGDNEEVEVVASERFLFLSTSRYS